MIAAQIILYSGDGLTVQELLANAASNFNITVTDKFQVGMHSIAARSAVAISFDMITHHLHVCNKSLYKANHHQPSEACIAVSGHTFAQRASCAA